METTRRHYEYIIHYENEIAREKAKKRPRPGYIVACENMIAHSRKRITFLNNA